MKRKRVLGLNLGTNYIGWALVTRSLDDDLGEVIGAGSRIIPMNNAVITGFEKGVTKSQTADRTEFRGTRKLYERSHIRRERLHRVLNVLNYLPSSYAKQIDFKLKKGQFKKGREPLLAYDDAVDENGKRIFLFKESYNEMEKEFRKLHTNIPKLNKKGTAFKLPYDWTLYYLRKKALTQKITDKELAWILLNFNQKRGYYQERANQEIKINETKQVRYEKLKVYDFVKTGEFINDKELYHIIFEKKGIIYDDTNNKTTNPELWKNKTQDFIITTVETKKGINRSYRVVKQEEDWEAIKRKTEQNLGKEFVGKYIYECILKMPNQKIKGQLIKTIDRDFYFDELQAILHTQLKYRKEWNDTFLYKKAVEELYPNNKEHQLNLLNKEDKFIHLFLKDILFYHRPLKSKKSLITKCLFEQRIYIDAKTKERKNFYINGIPKSHPLFQEFRVWQLVNNIKLERRALNIDGKIQLNTNVTPKFLSTNEQKESFFKFLYNKKELKQKELIAYFIKDKKEQQFYKWNYTDDDKAVLACNETRFKLLSKLDKKDKAKYNRELEYKLWHIIYSVTDKIQYDTAIEHFVTQFKLSKETQDRLKNVPLLKKEYASYSEKAIKKLLSIMRIGSYWSAKNITTKVLKRIDKLLTGKYNNEFTHKVKEKVINLNELNNFKGLPLWLASYIVYGKNNEVDIKQWKTSKELLHYINNFKQHSIRNPIVEQVLLESLRITLDVWEFYGAQLNIDYEFYIDEKTQKQKKSYNRIFDEIHIELSRNLKKPKKIRELIADQNKKQQETNNRIRKMLHVFKNTDDIEEVIPSSKTHFDKLKIYEQTILANYTDSELKKETITKNLTLDKFLKNTQPTNKDILKYKLWLTKKYKSPYTGKTIPLSTLFTKKYEIEHIIPQSKFIDNSFNNKVICETEVNQLKDNKTAYVFIQEYQNTEVPLSNGGFVTISNQVNYETFINENYKGVKKQNLLLEDIPKNNNEHQKNNTYISKTALKIYSNIVREEHEQETMAKNVLETSGNITAKLKAEWGLNAVWSSLVEHRFKRLNKLICGNENNGLFGSYTTHKDENNNFFKPQVPIELRNDFQIKRIDYRNYALDAIIIACTTKNHVNYINNQHKKLDIKRFDLGKTLRETKKVEKTNVLTHKKTKHIVLAQYKKPWNTFTTDSKNSLKNIIISFKQNLRVINKAQNINWRYKNEAGDFVYNSKGKPIKQLVKKTKGTTNWVIRKPLHENTFYGVIENGIYEGDLVKRELLDTSFTEKKIATIVDYQVKNILLKHLQQNKYKNLLDEKGKKLQPNEVAFSFNGINDLNNNIVALNNGIFHHPIKKVRCRFTKGKQFSIKTVKNKHNKSKKTKYVKTATGTNLYFCIYENNQDRKYYVPSFEEIIETQKQEINVSFKNKKNVPQLHPNFINYKLKFYLQPNDLVYLPKDKNEEVDFFNLTQEQLKRIYLFKDGSGTTANFTPMYAANVIYNLKDNTKRKLFTETYKLNNETIIKNEFGLKSPQLKNQNGICGTQIKSVCWKLKVDRLGNFIRVVK